VASGYTYQGTGQDSLAQRPRPINHGTRGGYLTHKNRDELACIPCAEANRVYIRKHRQRGKCAPGLGWPLEAR
jgi:hypothetical protein